MQVATGVKKLTNSIDWLHAPFKKLAISKFWYVKPLRLGFSTSFPTEKSRSIAALDRIAVFESMNIEQVPQYFAFKKVPAKVVHDGMQLHLKTLPPHA